MSLFEGGDEQVRVMTQARATPAVLKLMILSVRSCLSEIPIFIFEGQEDKSAYSQWIRRLSPTLIYEPLPASGKDQALKFWDSLLRNNDELARNIYIFIDRDFDDLKGLDPHHHVFMTQRYAIENYLVSEDVLDDILKDDLHFHGYPYLRSELLGQFKKIFSNFLELVKEINFKIYCARKLKIDINDLPKKISKIAQVNLDSVVAVEPPSENCIEYSRCISEEECFELRKEFESLDPELRYRGKFNLMFFMKWVELASRERLAQSTLLMKSLEKITKVGSSYHSIGNLASRSDSPEGLAEFLSSISIKNSLNSEKAVEA